MKKFVLICALYGFAALAAQPPFEVKGFAAASFNYNFNRPANSINTGMGLGTHSNQFMFNDFSLKLQKVVDFNPSEWLIGFKTHIILGQDATFRQARGLALGAAGDLVQAYVQLNIPVGNGLTLTLGKHDSPIGYEPIDRETNPNWSPAYQWTLLVPFTHTGVKAAYKINNSWKVQLLVNNGWDITLDNNHAISYLGSVEFALDDTFSANLYGYAGPEQASIDVDPLNGKANAEDNWRKGLDVVLTYKPFSKLTGTLQVDYGHETQATATGDAQWWALGAWLTYDFSNVLQAALHGDFIDDMNGARSSGSPAIAPFPANSGQQLYCVGLTLNIRPLESLRIAPEFRFDGSSLAGAFDGRNWRIITSIGALYAF